MNVEASFSVPVAWIDVKLDDGQLSEIYNLQYRLAKVLQKNPPHERIPFNEKEHTENTFMTTTFAVVLPDDQQNPVPNIAAFRGNGAYAKLSIGIVEEEQLEKEQIKIQNRSGRSYRLSQDSAINRNALQIMASATNSSNSLNNPENVGLSADRIAFEKRLTPFLPYKHREEKENIVTEFCDQDTTKRIEFKRQLLADTQETISEYRKSGTSIEDKLAGLHPDVSLSLRALALGDRSRLLELMMEHDVLEFKKNEIGIVDPLPTDTIPDIKVGEQLTLREPSSVATRFQPDILPKGSWVAVLDLQVVEDLTNQLGIDFSDELVRPAHEEIVDALKRIFGDTLVTKTAANLQIGAMGFLSHLGTNDPNVSVVAMDSFYAPPDTLQLHATRLINHSTGKITKEAQRAGYAPIDMQIAEIVQRTTGNDIILTDDVIFSGNSVLALAQIFRQCGKRVTGIVAGVTTSEGKKLLERNGIRVYTSVIAPSPQDVVDIRDLLGGVPFGGRAIDDGTGNPATDAHGIGFRVSYVYPHGDPVRWAGIPEGKAHELSILAWEISQRLYERLGNQFGKAITIGDFQNGHTAFPGPVPKRIGADGSLNLKIPVEHVLEHKGGKAKALYKKSLYPIAETVNLN